MQACTPGRRSVLSAVLSSCQAYLAFINKEVESCSLGHGALSIGRLPTLNHQGVPTLDPAGGPLGEGSSIAMQGVGCVDGKETENQLRLQRLTNPCPIDFGGDPPTSFGAGEKRSGGITSCFYMHLRTVGLFPSSAKMGWLYN